MIDCGNTSEVTLYADDFLLRPWRTEEAAWYVEARDDEVLGWTTEKRDLTVEEAEMGIRQANSSPEAICLAIVDNKDRELLGNIALAFEEKDRTTAEIMIWLAPRARGRGIATGAVTLLCRWAFYTLGLEQVTLKIRPGNVRSRRMAERAGFQRPEVHDEGGAPADWLWFTLSNAAVRPGP